MLLITCLFALGGCSTVYDLCGGTENGPQAFGGVRTWPELYTDTFDIPRPTHINREYWYIFFPTFIIDGFSSYAADFALLPVTLVFEIFRN